MVVVLAVALQAFDSEHHTYHIHTKIIIILLTFLTPCHDVVVVVVVSFHHRRPDRAPNGDFAHQRRHHAARRPTKSREPLSSCRLVATRDLGILCPSLLLACDSSSRLLTRPRNPEGVRSNRREERVPHSHTHTHTPTFTMDAAAAPMDGVTATESTNDVPTVPTTDAAMHNDKDQPPEQPPPPPQPHVNGGTHDAKATSNGGGGGGEEDVRTSQRVKERQHHQQHHHHHHHHHHDEIVPVKEIHMTRKEKEDQERLRRLDSNTLHLLREALTTQLPQATAVPLNDDEIVHFLMKVDRDARHLSHLQGGSHPEESDGSLLDELVAQAEDLALGREVWHKAVATVHKKHLGTTDRKTMEWVRKAAGLGKSKMERVVQNSLSIGDNRLRYTRNMARSTREERASRGLQLLREVVDELEPQLGPYPPYKPKKRKRPPPPAAAAEDEPPKPRKSSKRVEKRKAPPPPPAANSASHKASRANGQRTDVVVAPKPRAPPVWDDAAGAQDWAAAYDFPLPQSSSPATYARRTLRLWRRWTAPVLAWARYEFFYGDVDRAWYVHVSK